MFQDGGYQKFKIYDKKFYKAVTLGLGRRRYSRATFKRATDAEVYGRRLLMRINKWIASCSAVAET